MPDDSTLGLGGGGGNGGDVPPVPVSPLGPIPADLAAPGGAITLAEEPPAGLWQIAALAGGHDGVAAALTSAFGAVPGPGERVERGALSCLRLGPRQWLLVSEASDATAGPASCEAPSPVPIGAESGTVLDLSHARCRLMIGGPSRWALMARLVAPDLRPGTAPVGHVASMPLHGVAITVVVEADRFALYLPRSQSRSMVEMIAETALGLTA